MEFFRDHFVITFHCLVPRSSYGKKSKKNQEGPGVKCSAPDHFKGYKKQFLDSQAILYQQALNNNNTTEFYNKVTQDFVVKYGDSEPFALEPEEDPSAPCADTPVQEALDEEEAADAAKRWSKLRTVSSKDRVWTSH